VENKCISSKKCSNEYGKDVINIQIPEIASFCELPEQFQNSVWIDSDKGELKFSTTNMTGWEFQTENGDLFENWECLHTSTDSTKLLLIMV
jgi:hypothetical protein